MTVGTMKIKLHLSTSTSLKDKRSVLQSSMSQIRNRFQVAVAEVDESELWQIAVIGVVCVSNSNKHSSQILNSVMKFVESLPLEIIESQQEIISVF